LRILHAEWQREISDINKKRGCREVCNPGCRQHGWRAVSDRRAESLAFRFTHRKPESVPMSREPKKIFITKARKMENTKRTVYFIFISCFRIFVFS